MRQSGKTLLISTHIIDSVDMLWDRTVIMQTGHVKANVSKAEIDGMGKSLEDLFFEVTEGVDKDAVSEKKEENTDAAGNNSNVSNNGEA
jgi:ABC-type multidrug transport system ATPase subunit